MASAVPETDNVIDVVQCDGMVVMKLIKHCHDESSLLDVAQGALLGLLVDRCLEITNSFPFVKSTTNEGMEGEMFQLTMMRRLRCVNVDHYHVGWYQSAIAGNFFNMAALESQYHYQKSIEESVVLIYDTQKSSKGTISLKAYRLTPEAKNMYKNGDFTLGTFQKMEVGYEKIFVEIPLIIKNSPLTDIMMSELMEMLPTEMSHNHLDLGTDTVLENHMQSLIEQVDELYQKTIRFSKYQQAVCQQEVDKQNALAKQANDNVVRMSRGEAPIMEEQVLKQFHDLQMPSRLTATLVCGQMDINSRQMLEFSQQALAKLFISKSLQKTKEMKQDDDEQK